MRQLLMTAAAVSLSLGVGGAYAGDLHGGDVLLIVENDRIVTNRITSGGDLEQSRLFNAQMSSFFGYAFTSDPGLDSPAGAFPTFTSIQLNIVDALRRWDGDSFNSIAPVRMEVTFGATSIESPETFNTHVAGPTFAVNQDGKIHVHPDHLMSGSAPSGLYLLAFEVTSSAGSIGNSEPFYYMYIWEHTDLEEQSQARQWVIANLINSEPDCPWDLTGSGSVGSADLGTLLGCWGAYNPGDACEIADFTASGSIGSSDLGAMLGNWGVCP